MKALDIVNKLLEADEEFSELEIEAYAKDTFDPVVDPERLASMLRDELVEAGWRNIRISINEGDWWASEGHKFNSEDKLYVLTAGVVDRAHRVKWLAGGGRVIPEVGGETEWNMRGWVTNTFKGACKRAGMQVTGIQIPSGTEGMVSAHQGLDYKDMPEDFEDDWGDWRVTIEFQWKPILKYWSRYAVSKPIERSYGPRHQPTKRSAFAAGDEDERIEQRLKQGAPERSPEADLEHQKAWSKATTEPLFPKKLRK